MAAGADDVSNSLRGAGKLALSRALSRVEAEEGSAELADFLDAACRADGSHVLGLTGPPGVGKSTLTNALIRAFRARGETVGVLAIDPSSRFSGGALLGDRTRLSTDPDDQGVFVRSMAARDRLGGLSDHAIAGIAILRAAMDRVIVESVGIGQSEADVAFAVDTVVLCIQPGSGDSLQFMKAGVMELPDIVAVTKGDMGQAARRAVSDVEGALSLGRVATGGWPVPVLQLSARDGVGIGDLIEKVDAHRDFLGEVGRLARKRAAQQAQWLRDMVRVQFGKAGLRLAEEEGLLAGGSTPFTALRQVSDELNRRLGLV
ncbi:methylmalonyl Co-A mutase-associated GTPase MeaB [Polymorphum gilvum]|uniref:Putative periplasmic protein kinase ArgK and related GTPases of G3E family n=1 Tax=Polymorphum gilvum (strain LMG 25793 / CGMCC 1.9160 / SL003B-26A1) TaxID=991905 RepID=F2J4Z9_POLGS|nr:methylmalonyl Co-A mutase-associated GTPase MeaB [Polymorphum gilvum]ADZ70041.1 Putative periplasmic protein kinase ArgK and related GTPases of G3E family [Polymorphum gilvum SL003B-26A1]